MEGATVAELLAALRPLIADHASMPVVLQHEHPRPELLTCVEVRSVHAQLVDLYSGTAQPSLSIDSLARALAQIVSQGGANYEVDVHHPAAGSEPLVEIGTDGASLILTT